MSHGLFGRGQQLAGLEPHRFEVRGKPLIVDGGQRSEEPVLLRLSRGPPFQRLAWEFDDIPPRVCHHFSSQCHIFKSRQLPPRVHPACSGQGCRPLTDRLGLLMATRVLIADDHEVVRQGLRTFLELDPDLVVVGEAVNGTEAVREARHLRPDVVLMDLLMPEMDGVTAIEVIRKELPETEIIALTSVLEDASVVGAIRAGAIGYLLKDTRADELRRAIKAAAAGQVQLSPRAAARLMREVRTPEAALPGVSLSPRETEVLRLLAGGRTNKEMARQLAIGEKTIKTHVSRILSKLDVQSRTQAALYAGRIGLVPVNQLGANREE